MAVSKRQKECAERYKKKNIRRIPLDVQNGFYEEIKSAAEESGESVNGFIKEAIKRRLSQEK